MRYLIVLILGTFFGIVIAKSEVISWFRIQKMFRFQEAHMYLVMFSAILVGVVSLQLIKRMGITPVTGEPLQIKEKPFQKGIVFGGILFGLGWAVTGACPGPIYAQIGAGELPALATLGGALLGAYLYALLRPRLPH